MWLRLRHERVSPHRSVRLLACCCIGSVFVSCRFGFERRGGQEQHSPDASSLPDGSLSDASGADGSTPVPPMDGGSQDGGLGLSCCNTPPIAKAVVRPVAGTTATTFRFSAEQSIDLEDATGDLRFMWDWDADGVVDSTSTTATHQFGQNGFYPVSLRVEDTGGLHHSIVRYVSVSEPQTLWSVTSDGDAIDGSDGVLTLREAILEARTRPGPDVVLFEQPMVINISTRLPGIQGETTILGQAGVIVDGTAITDITGHDCITVDTPDNRIFGLEVRNCPDDGIQVRANNNWIAYSSIHDCGDDGVDVAAGSVQVGPEVESFRNASHGIFIGGSDTKVHESRIYENQKSGFLVDLSARDAELWGNVVFANAHGVTVLESTDTQIWHNTFYDSVESAIRVRMEGRGVVAVNNIIAFQQAAGMIVENVAGSIARLDRNLYWANPEGDCLGCMTETSSIAADPRFMDVSSQDFRIQWNGPGIDQAVPSVFDVNGPAPGVFEGRASDIGAWEHPFL